MTPLFLRGHQANREKNWHVVVPLYYRWETPSGAGLYSLLGGGAAHKDGTGQIISPLYIQTRGVGTRRFDLIPPLLSWCTRRSDRTDWQILGPLSRWSRGTEAGASYLLPLFYRNPDSGTLVTPLYQRGGGVEDDVRWHAVAPLYLRRQSNDSAAWITPLGAVTRNADGDRRTITPLYVHLLEGTNASFRAIPPLLSWQTRADAQTEQGTEDQPHAYVRRRILWRVWHYERLNGHVSVDSLPFITYDSRPDGFRKLTFLWRGFRYEKDPQTGTKLDVMFLPIRR